MHYRGAKIQIMDLPGIIEGANDGKGRGRQVIAAAGTCNVILIVLDAVKSLTHKLKIEKELYGFGIRLNQEPADIVFKKKEKGPINFQAMVSKLCICTHTPPQQFMLIFVVIDYNLMYYMKITWRLHGYKFSPLGATNTFE